MAEGFCVSARQKRRSGVLRFVLVLCATPVFADLSAVMAEPDLEKRSEKALIHAEAVVDTARSAYREGSEEAYKRALGEVLSAAELSYKSLQDTGKAARRHPKYWKRAEKGLRSLMRKIQGLEQEVSFEDRAAVETIRKKVSDLHDLVLTDIMTKKK